MTSKLFQTLAWIAFAAIIFVTISPIEFRPHDFAPVNFDRAAAFAVVTTLFVLAHPRRWLICAVFVMVGAGAIESLQFLAPTRHAEAGDAVVKALGAGIGTLIGMTLNQMRFRAHSWLVRSDRT
jgi:VanZ family protein